QVGSETDDCPHVEIAVCPAVEPVTDSRREGIVDGRMTERALNADRAQRAAPVEKARYTDDRVEFDQCQRDGRVVRIHQALAQLPQHRRERVEVHLETDRERGLRADAAADAAEAAALDGLVQLERVAPERFVAEGIEAEGVAPGGDQIVLGIPVMRAALISIARVGRQSGEEQTKSERSQLTGRCELHDISPTRMRCMGLVVTTRASVSVWRRRSAMFLFPRTRAVGWRLAVAAAHRLASANVLQRPHASAPGTSPPRRRNASRRSWLGERAAALLGLGRREVQV